MLPWQPVKFLLSIQFLTEQSIIVFRCKQKTVDRVYDNFDLRNVEELVAYYKKLGFTQFKETPFMYASVKEILDRA